MLAEDGKRIGILRFRPIYRSAVERNAIDSAAMLTFLSTKS